MHAFVNLHTLLKQRKQTLKRLLAKKENSTTKNALVQNRGKRKQDEKASQTIEAGGGNIAYRGTISVINVM